MLCDVLSKTYEVCFHSIGGDENADVRYIKHGRPAEVTRASFFSEAAWAIHASGVSRKVNAAFCDRATDAGFSWDFSKVAAWSRGDWEEFFSRLYHHGVSGRGQKKWAAVECIALTLVAYRGEDEFRASFFGGKARSAELNRDDVRRLRARRLPFIGPANAEYVVRNMGGEAIKCDRWIAAFLDHAGFTGPALECALVGCGISLSLFDVVLWAYCERHIHRVADLPDHFGWIIPHGVGFVSSPAP